MWQKKEIAIGEIESMLSDGYEIEVDSPDGYIPINFFIHKGIYDEYVLISEENKFESVRCNEDHLFETSNGWVSAKNLVNTDYVEVLTKNGFSKGKVIKTGEKIPIVDINVEHHNHRYYTNEVSSHNTGVGKSLFMCHLAASCLAQNKNVLYITLEMAEERIAERIDANLLNTNLDDLEKISKDLYEKKFNALRNRVQGKLIIKEYPTASASVTNFRSLIDELKLKRNFKPDIIFIDYLNICASSRMKHGANVNSYTYIKAIAEELRGLAVEQDVPIFSATQTTRSGFSNSDPGLEDTSESFGLPATADFMFALVATEELHQMNQIMVKQLKNRYSDPNNNKRFVIGVDRPKMKLYDVEESAQKDIVDSGQDDEPINTFGNRERKFNKKFEVLI